MSPVLKAINDAMLTRPTPIPVAPEQLVEIVTQFGPNGITVRMLPTPALLSWLAFVRKVGCEAELPKRD